MKKRHTTTIGDRYPDLRNLLNNQPTPHSQGDRDKEQWKKFCELYQVAVKRGNRAGFIPQGVIPYDQAVIIREGKVRLSDNPDLEGKPPTPEILQAMEAWKKIWEGLGSEFTPWEKGLATAFLVAANTEEEIPNTEEEIPNTEEEIPEEELVVGFPRFHWGETTVPFGIVFKAHPQEKTLEIVRVYNDPNNPENTKVPFPSCGTKITFERIKEGAEGENSPIAMALKALKTWAKVEAAMKRHTSLCSPQQTPQPHLSQEQAQHQPTGKQKKPSYRRRHHR